MIKHGKKMHERSTVQKTGSSQIGKFYSCMKEVPSGRKVTGGVRYPGSRSIGERELCRCARARAELDPWLFSEAEGGSDAFGVDLSKVSLLAAARLDTLAVDSPESTKLDVSSRLAALFICLISADFLAAVRERTNSRVLTLLRASTKPSILVSGTISRAVRK